ncbi:MAG: helix-turn-helix domain-containing protein [Planctomycetes bacterium]|nr:helix-turn-helix domain-containing protein [Planctomycetota bacterium]
MSRRHIFIKLNESELKELQEFASEMAREKKLNTRRRANALAWSFQQGWSVQQIARDLNRTPRTIYNWFKRYKQKGIAGLYDKPRPAKLTNVQIIEMMRTNHWIYTDDKTYQMRWSFQKMAKWVKEKWGIELSAERIRQIIRRKNDAPFFYLEIINNPNPP